MTRLELGELHVRDAEPGGPRKVGGYGVRWGQVAARTEDGPEAFAPASFRDALRDLGKRPVPFLDRHEGEVIGVLRPAEDDTGLALDGSLFATPAADAWAERSTAGVDGASIEFLPGVAVATRDGVTLHRKVARLVAVAASYKPAHIGASLSLRDMEVRNVDALMETRIPEPDPKPEPEPDPVPTITAATVEGIVHREVTALKRSIGELSGVRPLDDPYAKVRDIANLGELVRRVVVEQPSDTELRGIVARALADQLTTTSTGAVVPGIISDIKGIVTRARTAISAFGGPRPLGDGGMNVIWPTFSTSLATIVGEQATQKTEITVRSRALRMLMPPRGMNLLKDASIKSINEPSPLL